MAQFTPFAIGVRGRVVEFRRPAVMGILNITDDSFYDGGRYREPAAMVAQAQRLLADGADIIDVGASSSRPGATLLPPDEEARRLAEAVTLLRQQLPEALLSVDTCYAMPARAAIAAGADIINDISGGQFEAPVDGIPPIFAAAADLQAPYILMHTRGTPDRMQLQTGYDDIVDELARYFSQRLDLLYRLGVKDVWLDPGFGFAKSLDDNYELLRRLGELATLFREPLLTALSRKSMIYKRLGTTPDEALDGTTALDAIALFQGSRLLRVHDPKPARETIKLLYNA